MVVEGCTGMPPRGGRAVCTMYGPVVLDKQSPYYVGAELMSNNTGELSAMCEAFKWLAEHEHSSEYAANQAQNLHLAHKNQDLSAKSTVR